MTDHDFAVDLLSNLPYRPNDQQMQVALALARFCGSQAYEGADRVFVLNGYAGTGKTSLTGALVKSLRSLNIETVLLAPTGRAAKVFGAYAGTPASTIHRRIYRHVLPGSTASAMPGPRENTSKNAVFIVDEASMIGADDERGSNLLGDLVHYVYTGENCRMILLGDTAQLPPVGQELSPAMDPEVLRSYGLKVTRTTLTEVARQDAGSGILHNATRLRRALAAEPTPLVRLSADFNDINVVDGADLPDTLDNIYRRDGIEETIVITRSNLSATEFNRGIRSVVLDREEELVRGDLMIAAKNNYFWTRKVKGLDFVANGEILELVAVHSTEVRYGMRFADVTFTLPDRHDVEFDAKIVLGCLTGTAAALDREATNRLYEGIYNDPTLHAPEALPQERLAALRLSPYWNALQMKYAYAVTCHKAQGGQWSNVFVDLSYIPPEQVGNEFYRWLYTAVTRSRSHLYLINPPEELMDR